MGPYPMSPYHVMLMHFPIALWTTAALIILIRTFSDGKLARAGDGALTLLLFLGAAGGVLTFVVGFLVWPFDAVSSSPLARNHMLLASWTLAYWTVVWFLRWRGGGRVWHGPWRWLMLALATVGVGLQTITATIGGHLGGNPSAVSEILSRFGWEIYTTFFLPDWMLILLVITAVAIIALGRIGGRGQA